jgi:hypothetical protein
MSEITYLCRQQATGNSVLEYSGVPICFSKIKYESYINSSV